jgi:hypothetical protein
MALEWVLAQYRQHHSDWHVQVVRTPTTPWVKAEGVMQGVQDAAPGVVLVADADVWCWALDSAVRAVTCGVAPWAVPHARVMRLNAAGSALLVAGQDGWQRQLAQPIYRGLLGGGYVVAHRDTLLEVPMDPRFRGWGHEEESWAKALHTLAGPCWRGRGELVHLWHQPQRRVRRRMGSVESWNLRQRYRGCDNDQGAMRALLDEIGDRGTDPDPMPDRAAAAV